MTKTEREYNLNLIEDQAACVAVALKYRNANGNRMNWVTEWNTLRGFAAAAAKAGISRLAIKRAAICGGLSISLSSLISRA